MTPDAPNVYSQKYCDERHVHIESLAKSVETRLVKLENRFFATLMLLFANLIGVTITLVLMLVK